MMSMGEDGYMDVADRLMKTTQRMKEGVARVPVRHDGLYMCCTCVMCAHMEYGNEAWILNEQNKCTCLSTLIQWLLA